MAGAFQGSAFQGTAYQTTDYADVPLGTLVLAGFGPAADLAVVVNVDVYALNINPRTPAIGQTVPAELGELNLSLYDAVTEIENLISLGTLSLAPSTPAIFTDHNIVIGELNLALQESEVDLPFYTNFNPAIQIEVTNEWQRGSDVEYRKAIPPDYSSAGIWEESEASDVVTMTSSSLWEI